jgi:hypothetical protein
MDFIDLLVKLSGNIAAANIEERTGLLAHLDMGSALSFALGSRS